MTPEPNTPKHVDAGHLTPTDVFNDAHPYLPSAMWRMLSCGSPNKRKKLPKGVDAIWDAGVAKLQGLLPRQRRFMDDAKKICALESEFAGLTDDQLKVSARDMRDLFRLGREQIEDVIRAFAIVREVAKRTVGMCPYPVQLAAGAALYSGCVAELATGEGKTLSATLPATIFGWRGRGCHVITVNEYLAQRDAEEMSPIYNFCGLTVAHVHPEMSPDERRQSYLADITYCPNKEVTADFLRDRLILSQYQLRGLPSVLMHKITEGDTGGTDRLVMRGLEFAVVDEADSVLIDEAVTPLIIAGGGPNEEEAEAYRQAAKIAEQMDPKNYVIDQRFREARLKEAGKEQMIDIIDEMELGGLWIGVRRSEELLTQALTARDLFHLGKHYVIQHDEEEDVDKICIVDEFTGRMMPDRSWRAGLHQAVEAKEGVPITPTKETLARMSFQRFYRLYRKLSGMTGTAHEARHELWQIYKLPVVPIPTNKPRIRQEFPDRIYATTDERWEAVVSDIKEVHAQGRPILVGTRSVAASELLSELLEKEGLEHAVINAVRHEEEAGIVAVAGEKGKITVATNMAGRGTDIKPGEGVREIGGLHVIATERHESGRIDRQLWGRTGRQGDPGTAITYTSLQDELVVRYPPLWARPLIRRAMSSRGGEISTVSLRKAFDQAQIRAERFALKQRKGVLKSDDWLDEFLGFASPES